VARRDRVVIVEVRHRAPLSRSVRDASSPVPTQTLKPRPSDPNHL